MRITFERVERGCMHNENIRKAGGKVGILYDHKVLIDGEHRATFSKVGYGIGYRLLDIDNEPITRQDSSYLAYKVDKQAEFSETIRLLLSADRIPTLAQIDNRRAERARKKAECEAIEAEAARVRHIEQHGVDLLTALEAALEWIDAVPRDVVANLPTMPGIDRDWIANVINAAKGIHA